MANAARSDDGGFVTLASASDKNFKEYLTKGTERTRVRRQRYPMVGSNRPNQGHHHQGRQIRDANIQSGIAFTSGADSESAANQRNAATAFPAWDAVPPQPYTEAGANTGSSRPPISSRRPTPPSRAKSISAGSFSEIHVTPVVPMPIVPPPDDDSEE